MIKKKTGEIFEFESVRYSIGDWVQCTESSEYAGLSGVIVEIRDGEDRETENPTPDIYCCLQIPKDAELVQQLEARFSGLYGKAVKIKDVPLDCVILSPDELIGIHSNPNCYTPEPDHPYPLCVGNGEAMCEVCAFYVNLDYNSYE